MDGTIPISKGKPRDVDKGLNCSEGRFLSLKGSISSFLISVENFGLLLSSIRFPPSKIQTDIKVSVTEQVRGSSKEKTYLILSSSLLHQSASLDADLVLEH